MIGHDDGQLAGLVLAAMVGRFVRFRHLTGLLRALFRPSRGGGGRSRNAYRERKRRPRRIA
jgi:hypothetical protein